MRKLLKGNSNAKDAWTYHLYLWKSLSRVQLFVTPCDPLYTSRNSPSQNTGVGSLSHLQGISPTHGLSTGLLHCRQILYQLSHKESPRILEWVAYPFSRESSWPRKWTGVSCIVSGFFYQLSYQGSPSFRRKEEEKKKKTFHKNYMRNVSG